MHKSSMECMKKFRDRYVDSKYKPIIYDFGGRNINGTYRELFEDCNYTSVDDREGKDIDITFSEVKDKSADIVISGQYIDKIDNPQLLFDRISRALFGDGIACIIGPSGAKNVKNMLFFLKNTDLKEIEFYKEDINTVLIVKKKVKKMGVLKDRFKTISD